MKKTLASIIFLGILASCGNNSETVEAMDGEVSTSISANSGNDKELEEQLKKFEKEEEARLKELEKTTTSLKYDKLIHDFGKVKQGSENTTSFVVTNTGKMPLIISDVSASCGCTLPKKPEAPIAPGKTDVIEVTFKPKPGQEGQITKTVTVTANTSPQVSKIEITAFVEK